MARPFRSSHEVRSSGDGAVAIGDPNIAIGTGAVAVGANNMATGQGAVAFGGGADVPQGGQADYGWILRLPGHHASADQGARVRGGGGHRSRGFDLSEIDNGKLGFEEAQ